MTTSQTYTSAGELATYEAKFGATTLFAMNYTRDSLGRISELQETVQGVSKIFRYAYDTTGRLEKVWRNDTLISTYTYDANGNRFSHTSPTGTVTGTYDAQDRLMAYGAATYLYTANGELQAKVEGNDTTRYTYDAFGNLVQVRMPRQKDGGQANGDLIEYLIDAQNRRVGKKVNGAIVKRWLYEGQLRPVVELDNAGNVTARYVYGMKVNVPEYVMKSAVTYRVITDHLGSVRLVIDQTSGTIAQRMDYDEWGNILGDSNPDFTPFGFGGGIYEQGTRLARFGVRDYDGVTGKWTSKDPIRLEGNSTNLFTYGLSDPVNVFDKDGRFPWLVFVAAAILAYDYANAPGPGDPTYPSTGGIDKFLLVYSGGRAITGLSGLAKSAVVDACRVGAGTGAANEIAKRLTTSPFPEYARFAIRGSFGQPAGGIIEYRNLPIGSLISRYPQPINGIYGEVIGPMEVTGGAIGDLIKLNKF